MNKTELVLQKQTKAYQYLEEALVLLLEKKRFDEISVRELVEKAGISRTAFYSQFVCKQDFAQKVIENTNSNATIIATDYQRMNFFSEENFVDYYVRFYNYVASKARLYSAMLGKNGLPQFRERMRSEALKLWKAKHFTDEYMARLTPTARQNCEVMLSYIISAHIGLIEYWLESGMVAAPEDMAHQIYHMTWLILKERNFSP